MAQLTCQNLCVGYDGQSVLQDLSFELLAGDYLCIVGKRLRQEYPYENNSRLAAAYQRQDFDGRRAEKKRDWLSAAADRCTKGLPGIREREIVLSGCQGRCGSRPFYNKEEKQLALDAMDKMQITQLARRCYRELSGGQQQRVLLARALCATRKMLLLDEPVSGLDPKVTAEMYALIEKLNCEDGITVIMISHDIAAAGQYASHILHIGDTVFFGTKADYLESPQGRLFDAKKGGDIQ